MQLVHRMLAKYGLPEATLVGQAKGYRNTSYAATLKDGTMRNLIVYKREPGIVHKIRCANYVADFLAGHGLPARATADPRILKLSSASGASYAALYTYLPGVTIPWEAYTMAHLKLLGATMSTMHATLSNLAQRDLPSVIDEQQRLLVRMRHYFLDPGVRSALQKKLGLLVPQLDGYNTLLARTESLPAQALHMDFVRGNVLFNNVPEVTGILDFEKTAWGPPIFDIARTLAFLLIDCKYKDEDKVRKYFLHSGYNKRGQGNFGPTPLLAPLVTFFLLHDFYKFLRHNPYESLEQNEHYTRTRDFLLKRNIIARRQMLK